jgi:OmpA-OmpF porin, OOP family
MVGNKIKISLILLCSCLSSLIRAQSLIPNGSFEEFTPTDNKYRPKLIQFLAGGWEFFSDSHKNLAPSIIIYSQKEAELYKIPDGRIYLLFFNFQPVKIRQYTKSIFQVPLKQTLEKESVYHFSYHLRGGIVLEKIIGDSLINNNLIHFYFSPFNLKSLDSIKYLKRNQPDGTLPNGMKLGKEFNREWMNLSFDYRARGDEKYLIFGIIDTIYTKYWLNIQMDKLQLIKLDTSTIKLNNLEIGSKIIIDNILFETDKSLILDTSFPILDKIISELNKNPKLKLEISGHTDNTGTDIHNQNLSENRAKAVVDYLTGNGIDKERLTYKGYGSTKPMADNSTEEGKAKNRRVEITIIEK